MARGQVMHEELTDEEAKIIHDYQSNLGRKGVRRLWQTVLQKAKEDGKVPNPVAGEEGNEESRGKGRRR